jgi:hypothetical protein
MTDRVHVGQQRPTRMRRIGERHMIVLPAQQAQVLSIDDIQRTLRTARQQEQATQQQLDRHRAFIADLEQQLERFKALPIERESDDPEVPQPEPPVVTAGDRDGGGGGSGGGSGARNGRGAHPLHVPRSIVLSDS